ncbi:MAG: hypothetical protein HZB46_10570 [Solirubrobacterales bacterium]|nr:hypothetical protein [Solirubrobacterales bacterium]
MSSRTAALALVLPVLALGGCTSGDKDSSGDFQGEQQQVAKAVEDLQSAGRAKDAEEICQERLAPALVKSIAAASKTDCQSAVDDALDDADVFELKVQKVAVNGNAATATVKSEAGDDDRVDELQLVKDGRTWKVASLGGSAG